MYENRPNTTDLRLFDDQSLRQLRDDLSNPIEIRRACGDELARRAKKYLDERKPTLKEQ